MDLHGIFGLQNWLALEGLGVQPCSTSAAAACSPLPAPTLPCCTALRCAAQVKAAAEKFGIDISSCDILDYMVGPGRVY